MDALLEMLGEVWRWIAYSSAKVVVLVAVIFVIQLLLREKLAPKWRYALWMLVAVQLVLPWAPESRLSLYNLTPFGSRESGVYFGLPAAAATSSNPSQLDQQFEAASAAAASDFQTGNIIAVESPGVFASIGAALPFVWLLGFAGIVAYVIFQTLRMRVMVGQERFLTDQSALDLLEDCKEELGCKVYLGVVATDRVRSPSLCGFIRPRLLLPRGVIDSLSPARLRHVFLHELAHLKRHDVAAGWLLAVVQALHWFNPLVWLACGRIRAAREEACDAFVLSRVGGGENSEYGKTIVQLLDKFSTPRRLPALAGISEDQSQMKRRITMIAQNKTYPKVWSQIAVVLMFLIAATAFTDARGKTSSKKWDRAFATDAAAVGQWASVDFVSEMADFKPGVKKFRSDLHLKGLSLFQGGGTSGPWQWSKGYLYHPGDKAEGRYHLKKIDGADYMFMEWMSGDVTIRGMKPKYYVLKKQAAKPAAKMAKSDSSPVGQWKSVDFVKDPKNFRPGQKAWSGNLFLKGVTFKPDGKTSGSWTWQKNQLIEPKSKYSAEFMIQSSGGKTYMFFPWISGDVTIRGEKPRYYVLEKIEGKSGAVGAVLTRTSGSGTHYGQAQKRSFVVDPKVVGSWESIDFVKSVSDFTPGLRSWGGDLYLKGLQFKENGITSGPWSWTKGWLQHPGDKSEGRYRIKTMGGVDYLFMEWISGDVTIRGMKPQHYVMRRVAKKEKSK